MLVAITAATGVDIAIKLLEKLKEKEIFTELIISKVAEEIIALETNYNISDIRSLAHKNYEVDDFTAPPASGSYKIDSMIIVPCSMKTLAAIANGYADNLITRAADVMVKEKRKLILVVRESPLSVIHLENMLKLARIGVIIAPPIPSYYIIPKSVDDLIEYTVGRLLDQMDIESNIKRWGSE
jgi:4-hydroxy-3-polyprenylbenzoate decarboxylase